MLNDKPLKWFLLNHEILSIYFILLFFTKGNRNNDKNRYTINILIYNQERRN